MSRAAVSRVARVVRYAPPCARVSRVLFCPFCRESFEGQAACPEHELALVEWTALASHAAPTNEDAALAWWSPAHGRGLLAAGALVTLLAFCTLSLASTSGALRMGGSMLKLALFGAPKLWIIAVGAIAQLVILARRRTLRALRRARLALLVVALVPALAAAWAYSAAVTVARELVVREGAPISVAPDLGALAIAVGCVLMIAGALRLGSRTRR
jgi:hypothetical protein